jgi:hypothetical protein
VLDIFVIQSQELFALGLALNWDPPDSCLLNS